MNAARHHTDGSHHTGDTTVLLTPVSVPRLAWREGTRRTEDA